MHRCLSSMVPLTMVEDMPSVSPWTPSHHYIIKCKDWTREYISKLQQLYSPGVLVFVSITFCLVTLFYMYFACMQLYHLSSAVTMCVWVHSYATSLTASSWGQQALMSLQEAILKLKKKIPWNKVVLKVFTYMLTQCMFFFYTEWLC